MSIRLNPPRVAISYCAVAHQSVGSFVITAVATRRFVVRRLTQRLWTRPLQVDAQRSVAEMRLYDPDAATAVRDAASDDLLVIEYTDDDSNPLFAVRLPGNNQNLHVPGCGPISTDELHDMIREWVHDTGAEPAAFAVLRRDDQ